MLLGLAWGTREEPSSMRLAARAFVETLEEADRSKAQLPMHVAQRRDWHYVPRERFGVALRDLDERERKALRALLRTTLSAAGEQAVDAIVALEDVLRELESTPAQPATWRDAGAYTICLFGDLASPDPWAWRFEGHHVVLHFTEIGNEVTLSPHFLGTNPARHERAGRVVEPLGAEQALARELVSALEGSLRERAHDSSPPPGDVLAGPGQWPRFSTKEGIALGELPESPRKLAERLLDVYVGRFEGAARMRAEELTSERGSLRFLWIGALQPGEPHYYRIHSPRFALEYQNSQSGANHVHTLWREWDGDFGGEKAGGSTGSER